MGSTPFNAFPFWVIFCHITLERSWVIGFCLHFCWMYTLPQQSPIANRVLHERQRKLIDVIDRHVMIFLTTYFRTTPMADVNFASLVRPTSLITCHHCVSFAVTLVICKLQRIYVTSDAASVYFDDADNATCKSRVGLPYSVLPVAERTIFSFGCERTRGSWFIHACNTTMQYAFVLHCCDVMALCTASQISNKKQFNDTQ